MADDIVKELKGYIRQATEQCWDTLRDMGVIDVMETAAAEIKKLRKEVSDEVALDKEIGRWQQEIYELCCKLVTVDGEEQTNIDGNGCDSGDPLDLTLDEISQAANYWQERCHDMKEALKPLVENLRSMSAARWKGES